MSWYQLFDPATEKWIALAVFVICFVFILIRTVKISYVSLGAAAVLLGLGIVDPKSAILRQVDWNVLAIYWGYGILAILFRESRLSTLLALMVLARIRKEKFALLFICALSAFLSSFMANPVVVIMLAPLTIEIAERLNASLFLYLVGLAISSNVVTTVTMVADPPALILAMQTGMTFLDFYWFQGKAGLGTLSVIGVGAALVTLLIQFRNLNHTVAVREERLEVSFGPLAIFVLSVLALALIPMRNPGIVGLVLGLACLLLRRDIARELLREVDWDTLAFLVGIFIVIGTIADVGFLKDFARWLAQTGIQSPAFYLFLLTWLSVAFSSFIDNVPYTVLMIPVCADLANFLGINPWPLYFGMLVGTGLGGNITPVGATANVLACGMLEKRGYRIDLKEYLRISVPFTLAAVGSVYVLLQLIWL